MKKQLITLAMLAVAALIAVPATGQSKADEKAAKKQAKQEAQMAAAANNIAALKEANFLFQANEASAEFGGDVTLNSNSSFLYVAPGLLKVQLPYASKVAGRGTLRVPLVFQTGRFDITQNALNGNYWVVMIKVDQGAQKYDLTLRYSIKNGATSLVVKPEMGDEATYRGSVQPN